MLQALKLNNEKWKKSSYYKEKSLVGLTPVLSEVFPIAQRKIAQMKRKLQKYTIKNGKLNVISLTRSCVRIVKIAFICLFV
jgi:hypothetical protein